MLFNSGIFILLFFTVYSVYWFLPVRGKHYLIILTSLIFYAYYSIPFLLMFLALLVINYWIGMKLIEQKNGRLPVSYTHLRLIIRRIGGMEK